jgi:hypothetical protein
VRPVPRKQLLNLCTGPSIQPSDCGMNLPDFVDHMPVLPGRLGVHMRNAGQHNGAVEISSVEKLVAIKPHLSCSL